MSPPGKCLMLKMIPIYLSFLVNDYFKECLSDPLGRHVSKDFLDCSISSLFFVSSTKDPLYIAALLLSCFHTSLPFDALPLCSENAACSFMVTALSCHAAMGSSQSSVPWIEFNCLRFATVGKEARLSIYWQNAAALGQWSSLSAVVQISPSKQREAS